MTSQARLIRSYDRTKAAGLLRRYYEDSGFLTGVIGTHNRSRSVRPVKPLSTNCSTKSRRKVGAFSMLPVASGRPRGA
jgi:hypothetical protein